MLRLYGATLRYPNLQQQGANMRTIAKMVLACVMVLAALSQVQPSVKASKNSNNENAQEDEEPSIYLTVLAEFTYYDPSLCDTQPINCMGDPDWTAGGYYVPDWYEVGVACPVEIPMGTVIRSEDHGDLICIDRGGSINITDDGVFRLDLLHHHEAGNISRQITTVGMELKESTIRKILENRPSPFVEPIEEFACPADNCETIFYTYGQAIVNINDGSTYIHGGTDYRTGSPGEGPVYASAPGKVTGVGYVNQPDNRCGGYVRIEHNDGWETLYCHLVDTMVEKDDYVLVGQQLGLIGFSGYTIEGEHVHFEMRKNGLRQDPELYMGSSGGYAPMPEERLYHELLSAGVDLNMELLQIEKQEDTQVAIVQTEENATILEVVELAPEDKQFGDGEITNEEELQEDPVDLIAMEQDDESFEEVEINNLDHMETVILLEDKIVG